MGIDELPAVSRRREHLCCCCCCEIFIEGFTLLQWLALLSKQALINIQNSIILQNIKNNNEHEIIQQNCFTNMYIHEINNLGTNT